MSITITLGKSGRLVVPKQLRDRLGLHEGSRLRLEVLGGKLEATPEADDLRIELKNGLPVIQGAPPLNQESILDAIKADRK
ncbi:AbrB/MazE/SpoVT family DNA-binding domain-containing protein [Haloferula sp.]|uniref:AbrB/MazE/SpoVT family DNA-binding domain-containing protein n=1 Tax=Haloferula sp. TaxID=2497595 RepID=UPI003C7483F1